MKAKEAGSAILAGFGSVTPRHRPEDFRAVREQVERAITNEVAREGTIER